jgi:hypothetical protein
MNFWTVDYFLLSIIDDLEEEFLDICVLARIMVETAQYD